MRIDRLSLPQKSILLRRKLGMQSLHLDVWVKLCTVCLVGLILSQRSWHRLWYPQLWYEDGTFFQDAYNLGFAQSLIKPFTSYYLFLNRLFAGIALLFRIELVPQFFTFVAFGIAVLVCSFFLLDNFSWLVPSVYIRAIFCLFLAALPGSDEVMLLFVDILWYLAILAFLLVLLDIPKSRPGKLLYVAGWLLLMLSTPSTVIFLPCLAFKAWLVREQRAVTSLACGAIIVGLAPLLWVGTAIKSGVDPHATPSFIMLVIGLVNDFAMRVLATTAIGYNKSYNWFAGNDKANLGYLAYPIYLIITLCILIPAIKRRQYMVLIIWTYCTYAMLASIGLALLRNNDLVDQAQAMSTPFGGPRYFVPALAAFSFLNLWWITTLSPRTIWLNVLRVALVIVMLVGIGWDFNNHFIAPDVQWSQAVRGVQAAAAGNMNQTVSVPTNPSVAWSGQLHIIPTFSTSLDSLNFSKEAVQGAFEFAGSEWEDTTVVPRDGYVYAFGWALNPQKTSRADEVVVVEQDVGIVLARTTMPYPRQDVADALGDQHFMDAGWGVKFPADVLNIGTHRLAAYVVDPQTKQTFPITSEQVVRVDYAQSEIVDNVQPQVAVPTGPIMGTQWVQQGFVAVQDGLVGVAVHMATYARHNTGPVTFYLQRMDDQGTPHYVASMTIDAATVKDGEDVLFRFEPLRSSKGQHFAIVIAAPQATTDNSVTAWMQQGDPYPLGQLLVAGKPQSGDLAFSLVYKEDN